MFDSSLDGRAGLSVERNPSKIFYTIKCKVFYFQINQGLSGLLFSSFFF